MNSCVLSRRCFITDILYLSGEFTLKVFMQVGFFIQCGGESIVTVFDEKTFQVKILIKSVTFHHD